MPRCQHLTEKAAFQLGPEGWFRAAPWLLEEGTRAEKVSRQDSRKSRKIAVVNKGENSRTGVRILMRRPIYQKSAQYI